MFDFLDTVVSIIPSPAHQATETEIDHLEKKRHIFVNDTRRDHLHQVLSDMINFSFGFNASFVK